MSAQENSRWERRTWPELQKLAAEVPEAGIHFQSKFGVCFSQQINMA